MLELSQRELAARARIGEKHLGEIERGQRDPRLSTIVRLLDALDLPTDTLERCVRHGELRDGVSDLEERDYAASS